MQTRRYTLTIKTSPCSATAFCISALSDEDAVGKARGYLEKVDRFYDRPPFEVVRADGTILRGIVRAVADQIRGPQLAVEAAE